MQPQDRRQNEGDRDRADEGAAVSIARLGHSRRGNYEGDERRRQRKPAHLRMGHAKSICNGDEGIAPSRLELAQRPQQRRIFGEARKPEHRPRDQCDDCAAEECDRCSLPATRHDEPDRDGPDEELDDHRAANRDPGERPLIAIPPRECNGQCEQRGYRAEAEGGKHGDPGQRDAVAAPVAHAEQRRDCESRRDEQDDEQTGRDAKRQRGKGGESEHEGRWVDEELERAAVEMSPIDGIRRGVRRPPVQHISGGDQNVWKSKAK